MGSRVKKATGQELADVLDRLRELCPPGTLVQGTVVRVSRSGMMRVATFSVATVDHMGRPVVARLDHLMARAGVATMDPKEDGLRFGGCGYSVTFEGVYSLGRTLYPGGFGCIGQLCPSNDHSNGDRDHTPHGAPLPPGTRCPLCLPGDPCTHGGTVQHWHADPGYCLRLS